MELQTLLVSAGAALVSLLLACNAYFIKRLIDKLDSTDGKAGEALRVSHDNARILGEIKSEVKELRHLEIDVAVMKSSLKAAKQTNRRKYHGASVSEA